MGVEQGEVLGAGGEVGGGDEGVLEGASRGGLSGFRECGVLREGREFLGFVAGEVEGGLGRLGGLDAG